MWRFWKGASVRVQALCNYFGLCFSVRGFCFCYEMLKYIQQLVLIIPNLIKISTSLAFQDKRWFLSLNMFFTRKKRKSQPSSCSEITFHLSLFFCLPVFSPMFSPAVWSFYYLFISVSLQSFLFFLSQDDGGKFWWGLVLSRSCYQLAPFAAKLFKPNAITLHISVFDLSIMEST